MTEFKAGAHLDNNSDRIVRVVIEIERTEEREYRIPGDVALPVGSNADLTEALSYYPFGVLNSEVTSENVIEDGRNEQELYDDEEMGV